MPGFSVPFKDSSFGGHGRVADSNRTDYYYTYTWQIFQLVGSEQYYGRKVDPLIHAKDITLPTFTANQDTYVGSSLEYKWAKSVTWDDIKVSWYDTVGLAKILSNWRKNVWSANDGLQVASQYKKRSQIDVYLPNGYEVVTWCLKGSWPKVIRQGELTYTNSEVKLVEVTVAYDWAEEKAADGYSDSYIEDITHVCAADSI